MIAHESRQTSAKAPRATQHQSANEATAPKTSDEHEQSRMTTRDALKMLLKQVHELKEYFSYYVTAKTDSAKLQLRNTLFWVALSALGLVTLAGFLVTASWFVLSGIAGGLSLLFGDRLWIGNIVTGVLASAGLGFGMYYAVVRRMRISRKRTIQKYEERQKQQQTEFGHKDCEQATDTASANK